MKETQPLVMEKNEIRYGGTSLLIAILGIVIPSWIQFEEPDGWYPIAIIFQNYNAVDWNLEEKKQASVFSDINHLEHIKRSTVMAVFGIFSLSSFQCNKQEPRHVNRKIF